MADVITKLARKGALSELEYVDDLILMSEAIQELWNKVRKLKELIEIKGLNINLGKTKEMVSGGIAKDGLSEQRWICSLKAKVNSVFCIQCVEWIHSRSVRIKRINSKL